MHKLTENILDKLSIDYLRNQVLKNAYGNDDTVIAGLDPRILLVWYLFFGLVPWFLTDVVLLLCLFVFVVLTTRAARIAPLVLFLFCVGVFSQTGYLFIVALFFGGNAETIAPLLVMTLKVAVVSLASITVFSGLDPDRLANGMLWFGCPGQLSFSISFAYRILPVLMEEFQNILLSYRLRGNPPSRRGLLGEDPISWISDTDDHPGILSADAQYGETLKDNSGSPGVTWVPLFCTRPQDKEDEACNAESDPGGYHLCMHFRGMGGRKYDTVCGNIVWEYGQGEDWQYED